MSTTGTWYNSSIAFFLSGIVLVIMVYFLDSLPALQRWQASFHRVFTQQLIQRPSFSITNSEEELRLLKQENFLLKQALNQRNQLQDKRVLSHPYQLIAADESSPLTIGSMVSSNGVLLGTIAQASAYAGRVRLLRETTTQPILVVSDSGVQGLIRGDGKNILMTEVPHKLNLAIGEKLMTVGQIEIAPGLLIGFIEKIVGDPSDPSQTALVKQPVEFRELETVEIN